MAIVVWFMIEIDVASGTGSNEVALIVSCKPVMYCNVATRCGWRKGISAPGGTQD